MIPLRTHNTCLLLGLILGAAMSAFTLFYQRQFQIITLNTKIEELQEEIKRLSTVDQDHKQCIELVAPKAKKIEQRSPTFDIDEDRKPTRKSSELRQSRKLKVKGKQTSLKSMMSMSSASHDYSGALYDFSDSDDENADEIVVDTVDGNNGNEIIFRVEDPPNNDRDSYVSYVSVDADNIDSSDNMASLVNAFIIGLQELADETNKFDLLTKELGTIASLLNTRQQQLNNNYGYQVSELYFDPIQNHADGSSLFFQQQNNVASAASCLLNSGCNDLGLQGECCPTTDGVFLSCCDVGQPTDTGTSIQDTNNLIEQMNASLIELDNQKTILSTSNDQMTGLNIALNDMVLNSISVNQELTNQNEALQTNMDALSGELGLLQSERNLLLSEITSLNLRVGELESSLEEQELLNEQQRTSILDQHNADHSNVQYATQNANYKESISELQTRNEFLEEQNAFFVSLNADLNARAANLSGEVDHLETQNNWLSILVDSLNDEISTLSDWNGHLNTTVQELTSEVNILSEENDSLGVFNTQLVHILSFLRETTFDSSTPLAAVVDFLSEQIAVYRSSALEAMHNSYIERVAGWDCPFREEFNDQGFISNGAVPLPEVIYSDVMDYINDRIVSHLCLNITDFQSYLDHQFNQMPHTMNHLLIGVEGYTTLALSYYFSGDGEVDGGLTAEDWAEAGYDCQNLTTDQHFLFDTSNASEIVH